MPALHVYVCKSKSITSNPFGGDLPMNRNKILILIAISLILSVIFSFGSKDVSRDEAYIFDNSNSNISMKDIIEARKSGGKGFAADRAAVPRDGGMKQPGIRLFPTGSTGPIHCGSLNLWTGRFEKAKAWRSSSTR